MAWPRYRQSKERIGRMRHRVEFHTPTRSRTALGGEVMAYALWTTTWAMVENVRATERVEDDRLTAFNTKRFICRADSLDGVSEVMKLKFGGEYYDITSVNEVVDDLPAGAYYEIVAERRQDDIREIDVLTGLMLDFAQKTNSFTGTDWQITAGTLPDTNTTTEEQIHQLCYLFRSGLRMVYGVDYTIQPGNVIRFTEKVRGENLLYHQYREV